MSCTRQVCTFDKGFKHKHYYGATREYDVLQDLKGQVKGFFIRVFFINDKVNLNKWQVTWESIKNNIADVVGVPIVRQDDLRHPQFTIQNLFAKGYIVDYELNEEKHEAVVIIRILDLETIQLIKDGKLKFVSPAIVARNEQTIKTLANGVELLSSFIALHLALVGEPAYGKVDAKIHNTCTGTGSSCGAKLRQMTAAVLSELSFFGDCVSDKIPILHEENPSMDHDQIVVIAISMCKEKGADSTSQKVDSLTQIPLLRRLNANINRLQSEFNMLTFGASKPAFENKWGYWVSARNMDVFVADGQTVDESINQQCGCSNSGSV